MKKRAGNGFSFTETSYIRVYSTVKKVSFSSLINRKMNTAPSTPPTITAANVHEANAVSPTTAYSVEHMLNQKNQFRLTKKVWLMKHLWLRKIAIV